MVSRRPAHGRGDRAPVRRGAHWFPFDLHPEYPPDGITRAALHETYGGEIRDARCMREGFGRAGLPYNPPPDVVPNTRDALRVCELARDRGLHTGSTTA